MDEPSPVQTFPGISVGQKLFDSVAASRRGIPLQSSITIDEDHIDVIGLERVRLIASVRRKLNLRRREHMHFRRIRPEKLAVIVPYRYREEHLKRFVPYILDYLEKQGIPFRILVVEPRDSLPFNRALLLTVGARICRDDCDFFCFHDVDLLPEGVDYTPGSQPLSLVSRRINDTTLRCEVMDSHFFGGVTLISKEQFFLVNGFSNRFWGWGFEDDNLLLRCLFTGLQPCRINNSEFREMNHHHGRVSNIRGDLARGHELKVNKINLRRGRRYQSRVKRGLEDPWENGVRQLKIPHTGMAPVHGVQRVGVDCSKLGKVRGDVSGCFPIPQLAAGGE